MKGDFLGARAQPRGGSALKAVRFLRQTLLLTLILTLTAARAAEEEAASALPPSVQDAVTTAGLPDSAIGIYAQDLATGRVLLAYGADRAMNPASTMKLLTTYAGLEMLGPAFTWKTEVWMDGTLRGGTLRGNLVLKGGGDPRLTLEDFWLMLRGLRNRGVKDIRGDLVLDRSAFAIDEVDPSRFDGDATRAYNVGPDALLVNFKALRVQLLPEPESNSVRLFADPSLKTVALENKLRLANGPCGDWRTQIGPVLEDQGTSARVSFRGSFPESCGERSFYLSVLRHGPYVGSVFRELWKELGGTLSGGVREESAGANAKLLLAWESPPLSELVRDINKFSNNVMARQLFLTIGGQIEGPPATAEKASYAIKEWLSRKGLSFPELNIENGSGLSRVERISARHLGELLARAYRSPVMPELMASLPVVSVDGTMRKRLTDAEVAGQAHVKSGSLEGVKTIAGYVLDARDRRVVVVCLVNHPRASTASGIVQDALLRWAYQRP